MKSASKMATNSPSRNFQPGIERSRLEAFAVRAVVIADLVSERRITLHHRSRHLYGFVGRVVEHLDLQLLARIFDLADAIHQAIDNILLVEDGQLNRHQRQFGEMRFRLSHLVLAVLVIQIDQLIAVHSVKRQQDQHHEIGNQQQHVEGIGVVQAFERGIEKMRPQVVAKPVRFHQGAAKQGEGSVQKRTPSGTRGNHRVRPPKLHKRLIVPDAASETAGTLAADLSNQGTENAAWREQLSARRITRPCSPRLTLMHVTANNSYNSKREIRWGSRPKR